MPSRAIVASSLLALLSVLVGAFLLWFACSTGRSAYGGYRIKRDWRPLAPPYTARVVGFPIWGNGRRDRIPTVSITFAGGRTVEFNSSRRGNFGVGDEVNVLTTRGEDAVIGGGTVILRRRYDAYEIDSAYHLWVKDAQSAAFCLLLGLAIPAWGICRLVSEWKSGRGREN